MGDVPTEYPIKDENGKEWKIEVDTTGHIVTTEVIPQQTVGSPIGLLLLLTYSN